GGAARRIPDPASRNVYTYIGPKPTTTNGVALANNGPTSLAVANTAVLTAAVLGTDATDPTRDKLINWARGTDVNDDDADNASDDARLAMGDPMHAQPAVVIYGG